MKVATGPGWEIRLGDFRDVAGDVLADALITDPPYLGARGLSWEAESVPLCVPYAPADRELLDAVCSVNVRGWRVVFNDHPGYMHIASAFRGLGLVVPANPVPWCKPRGAYTPNGTANSPAKSVDFIAVARPRGVRSLVQRPGYYVSAPYSPQVEIVHTGGKPLALMREIVRDYSDPRDIIFDPCAGGATTLLAAVIEGRRAIGCERDPDTFEKAVARLSRGHTRSLFADLEGVT